MIARETRDVLAWGRAHRFVHRLACPVFADEIPTALAAGGTQPVLARGCGRSYGDSGLNAGNVLIDMRGLDHVLSFDRDTGIVEAEAGVTLRDILALTERPGASPKWFPPVVPGTKFVTLGGAIANDIHGKNHHTAGCFGNHVLSLRLLRSDGADLVCSATENTDLFRATIGGLGLTGVILSARIALKAVPGSWLESEDIRFPDLDAFYGLAQTSLADWEYTVAWIDCLARGKAVGRGVFSRARHGAVPAGARHTSIARPPRLSLPLALPGFALSTPTVRAFNAVHWRRAPLQPAPKMVAPDAALFPLDGIGQWNLMYGRRGFYQYQCVVPPATARDAIAALLDVIARSGAGSFLAVLKTFGDRPSPGMLSFPMPGTTLALDFPNHGAATLALLSRLDHVTHDAGGRIYPAKDGRVSAGDFQHGYPAWTDFSRYIDPHFSSSFWRRVSAVPENRV